MKETKEGQDWKELCVPSAQKRYQVLSEHPEDINQKQSMKPFCQVAKEKEERKHLPGMRCHEVMRGTIGIGTMR